MKNKKAVCVLGMHRSGTSTITRALNIVGISLGETEELMKPGSDNPKGYWENKKIVSIHNQLLKLYSRTWDSTQPLPNEWWIRAETLQYRNMLTEIVNSNYLNNNLWMWKDPRTSLLLPLWKEILEDLNIIPYFIICIRNPLDVYLSLEKRNKFSKEKSFRLWNIYTLSSLFWTKNENRTFVHYDSLLNDTENSLSKILKELKISWPQNKDQVINELNAFIDQNMRHSYSTIDQLMGTDGLLKETKKLYPLLIQEIETPSTKFNNLADKLYHSLFTNKRSSLE